MRDTVLEDPKKKDNLCVILALQGGGALGAFQAGAYQALSEKKYEPWECVPNYSDYKIINNHTSKERLVPSSGIHLFPRRIDRMLAAKCF
jgi:hypothetical protein